MTALSEQQELFLDRFTELLESDPTMHVKQAANIAKAHAGYSDKYSVDKILKVLSAEIISIYQNRLALEVPKAVAGILSVLQDSTVPGAKTKLDAASIILDRAGLVKKEHVQVDVNTNSGIILIPAKKPINKE